MSIILEFFVFLIIGRNNPSTYNKIISNETINIALTAFIFIKIIFLLIVEITLRNYKVCDLYQADELKFDPMHL